jgi:hypothetical protein
MSSNAPIRFDDSSSSDDDYSDDDVGVITKRVSELPGPTKTPVDTQKKEYQHNFASNNIINLDSDSSDEEDDNTPLQFDGESAVESQDEEEPAIPSQVYECGICFGKFIVDIEDKAAAPNITLFGASLPCSHAYCDNCLREHTWAKLCSTDQNHIVGCPEPGCTQLITDDIAERVLHSEQIDEWYKRKLLASIENKVSHKLRRVNVD